MFKLIEGGSIPKCEQRLTSPSGASVEIAEGDAGERIRVHGTSGELVLEYDPETKKTRLCTPPGDLELESTGNISLRAAGDVRLRGSRAVELEAGDRKKGRASLVELLPGKLSLRGDRTELIARQADLFFKESRWAGERLLGKVKEVRLTTERVESVATTVKTTARNVYQTVEGVVQTKAGRLRTLVTDVAHLRARSLILGAEQDTRIKGEKIYLG